MCGYRQLFNRYRYSSFAFFAIHSQWVPLVVVIAEHRRSSRNFFKSRLPDVWWPYHLIVGYPTTFTLMKPSDAYTIVLYQKHRWTLDLSLTTSEETKDLPLWSKQRSSSSALLPTALSFLELKVGRCLGSTLNDDYNELRVLADFVLMSLPQIGWMNVY